MTREELEELKKEVNGAAEPVEPIREPKENRYQRIMRKQHEERLRRDALRKSKHEQRRAAR